MAKFLIIMFAVVACASAKPGLLSAPLVAAPFAAATFNAPLDAAYSSSRVDIQQKYGHTLYAAAPAQLVTHASPVAASLAAPLAVAPAKFVAPVAAPLAAPVGAALAYTNLPLDAAYASSRFDIHQNYGAALVPTAFAAAPAKLVAAVAPVAAPLAAPVVPASAKVVSAAPVAAPLAVQYADPLAYTNLPLDAAYASSRLDLHENYRSAFVPTVFAATSTKIVSAANPLAVPVAPVAPLKYTAAAPTS